MEKMNVLIVDDQINVVSGVMFGVHWDRLGISQVYKAYNAYEAKQVLLEKQVDIMLCDIEMPVENGLSLLAWCRKQEMDVETIFLTAMRTSCMPRRPWRWGALTIFYSQRDMKRSRMPSEERWRRSG